MFPLVANAAFSTSSVAELAAAQADTAWDIFSSVLGAYWPFMLAGVIVLGGIFMLVRVFGRSK